MKNKKIAIVYDWMDKWGGVERILLALHKMFPEAHYYTSYVDYKSAGWAKDLDVNSSFIGKFPSFIRKNRVLSLPFYPYVFESFNFSQYDVVLSLTSSFAKSIITKPATKHICYLLTPTRFLWVYPQIYKQNGIITPFSSCLAKKLREWDYLSAQRPDSYISISQTVADRCRKFYRRESDVIYPPFDGEYWNNIKNQKVGTTLGLSVQNYFLVVSRLESYKKVDLVVDVFNKLPKGNLVIVGKGTEERKLKQKARKNIHFLGTVTDEELGSLYSQAKALIMPQEEDFGYVAVEAQFFGCPVIALSRGGAKEILLEGKTALFFENQTPESLKNAIERFSTVSYNLKQSTKLIGIKQAEEFALIKFKEAMFKAVNN